MERLSAVTAWKSFRRSFSMQRLIHATVQVHLQVQQKTEASITHD